MWPAEHFQTIELNPTELCNMTCAFCPRAFDYPNQNLHVSLDIVDLMLNQLADLPNIKKIAIAGRGEPTLTNNFGDLAQKLIDYRNEHRPYLKLQIATNGNRVDNYQKQLKQFDDVRISIYDQSKLTYEQTYEKYNPWGNLTLYDRRTETINKGFAPNTYHNRAGSAPHPANRTTNLAHPTYGMICEKPLNVIYVSWNGDYNLCCNDWEDIQVLGNIQTEPLLQYVTSNPQLKKYQDNLLAGKRDHDPCSTCNRAVHPRWIELFKKDVDKMNI